MTGSESPNRIASVNSVWRYPVKGMCGEEQSQIFVDESGVRGDRLFAFRTSANRESFPYFTPRDQREMLLYRPRFDDSMAVVVETPGGETLPIDDPSLVETLRRGLGAKHHITLMRSERPMTDSHPVSIFSLATAGQLSQESGTKCDNRRFRANIYLDMGDTEGFAENALVGRSVRIGSDVVLAIAKRDSRCMVITLDPDSARPAPAVLQTVARLHGGTAGVYASVISGGVIYPGDEVHLLAPQL